MAPAEQLQIQQQQQQQAPGPYTLLLQQGCEAQQPPAALQLPRISSIAAPQQQNQVTPTYSLPANTARLQHTAAAAAAAAAGAVDARAGSSLQFACLSNSQQQALSLAPVLTACGSTGASSSSRVASPAGASPRHRGRVSSRCSSRPKRLPASFGAFLNSAPQQATATASASPQHRAAVMQAAAQTGAAAEWHSDAADDSRGFSVAARAAACAAALAAAGHGPCLTEHGCELPVLPAITAAAEAASGAVHAAPTAAAVHAAPAAAPAEERCCTPASRLHATNNSGSASVGAGSFAAGRFKRAQRMPTVFADHAVLSGSEHGQEDEQAVHTQPYNTELQQQGSAGAAAAATAAAAAGQNCGE